MADDIIVFGSRDDFTQTSTDHDAKTRSLLQRCQEKEMELNREKAKIKKTAIKLHGPPYDQ